MLPRPTGKSRSLDRQHAPKSDQTRLNQPPMETSSVQFAAGLVALAGLLLWAVWLLPDILSRIGCSPLALRGAEVVPAGGPLVF